MPGHDVIVGLLRAVPEAREAAPGGRAQVEVAFEAGGAARIDTADPRAGAWIAALSTMRESGIPAYVETDADTGLVTEVLVPIVVRVGDIRDAGDALEVELVISEARHWLPRSAPGFAEMLRTLEQARAQGAAVLVTERVDEHVIVDVRPLPDEIAPPPAVTEHEPEPPPVAETHAPPVSLAVANQMFAMLNGRTCCSSGPAAPCIPFTFPDDGCWGRAHEMCRLMAAQGVASDKVWIYGGLRVSSANKPDCVVRWGWHVAPTLPVTIGSSTQTYVIDPALFTSPVPRATWAGVQGDPNAQLVPSGSDVFYRGFDGYVQYDPTYSETNTVLARYRAQLQLRSASSSGPPPYPQCQVRPPGTQWFGTLAPSETRRWFTFGWPAKSHIVWTVMPTSICPGAPQLRWTTAVERADSTHVTYWITVTNLTSRTIRFEGRFDVLAA